MIKGWAVVNSRLEITDDGHDDIKGGLLIFYPVFKTKKFSETYRKETYKKMAWMFKSVPVTTSII